MTNREFVKAVIKGLFTLPKWDSWLGFYIWVLDCIIKILIAAVWADVFGRWSILSIVATFITYYLMDVPPAHQDWVYNRLREIEKRIRSRYGRD